MFKKGWKGTLFKFGAGFLLAVMLFVSYGFGSGYLSLGAITGTPNSSTYLRGDLAWATPAGGADIPVFIAASNGTTNEKAVALSSGGTICDGTADQTDINSALTTYKNVELSSGTFTCNGNILPVTGGKLIGQGEYLTTIALGTNSIYITDKDNVEIGKFKTTGTKDAALLYAIQLEANASHANFYFHDIWCTNTLTTDFGTYVHGATTLSNTTYERCFADSPDHHGWQNYGENTTPTVDGITYLYCRVTNAGIGVNRIGSPCWSVGFDFAEGSSIVTIQNLLAIGCTSYYSWESGFHFEDSPTKINCHLIACRSQYGGQKLADPGGPLYGLGFLISGDVELVDCEGTYNVGGGARVDYGFYSKITGGSYSNNGGHGINIVDGSNGIYAHAKIASNAQNGVFVQGADHTADDNIVSENHVISNGDRGIRIYGGAAVTARNQILNNRLASNATTLTDTGVATVIRGNSGYIAFGEHRSASGALTAGVANAISFAWHNAELQDILVEKVVVEVIVGGGTVGSHLDVGIADDAAGTSRGTEFFNDLLLNNVKINDSWLAGDGGTQTKWVFCQDSANVNDSWVVGQILDANAASLEGKYYVYYTGRNYP